MTREIKFRGRSMDSGIWEYGNYVHYTEDDGEVVHCIVSRERCKVAAELVYTEVDPDTVGQYVGLKDKNGRDIYEGDILRIKEYKNQTTFECSNEPGFYDMFTLDELKGELMKEYITPVSWEEGLFLLSESKENDTYLSVLFGDMKRSYPIFDFEVIGNIYDNPGLLKK